MSSSVWGATVYPADSNGSWRAGVSVDVVATTDDAVTYEVSCLYQTWWGYEVWSGWKIAAGDAQGSSSYLSASLGWSASSTAWNHSVAYGALETVATQRVTLERRAAAYTAWFTVGVWQHGGYGDGVCEAHVSVEVPAIAKFPPSAPAVGAPSRMANGSVLVPVSVNSSIATTLELQRQGWGTVDWTDAWRGAPSASVIDAPGAGSWRYRARNGNDDGWSAWCEPSEWVLDLAAPNAPTLVEPANGSCVDVAQGVRFAWRHNPADGSAATAYELRYSLNGGATWTTRAGGEEAFLQLPAGAVATGSDVLWDVRTAGASGELGVRSAAWSFKARSAPRVVLEGPAVVEALPFALTWLFEDPAGTQTSALVRIVDLATGQALWQGEVGSLCSVEVPLQEFAPNNGSRFAVQVDALSSTGLRGSTGEVEFEVSYEPPAAPVLELTVDERLGRVTVVPRAVQGDVPTVSMALFRDGVSLASGLHTGDSFVDKLPPLDVAVVYRAVAYAQTGAVSATEVQTKVPSCGFARFDFAGDQARCAMNLRPSFDWRPEVETYQTASAGAPVAFYGQHVEATGAVEGEVWLARDQDGSGEGASLAAFERLARHCGDVDVRLPRGRCLRATVGVSASHGKVGNVAEVSISWTEVG